MNTTTKWLACVLLVTVPMPVLAQAKVEGKKLYCWNENGRKICGDALPADAVDSARVEISAKSGIAMRSIDRALNDEERVAAADAKRKSELAANELAAEKRRDLAMVESYATEDDLRRAYGERITLVEESLKTSRLGIINLRQSLLSLLRQAANLELQAQPVHKPLTENIIRQHGDLLRQQDILQQQLHDHASLGSDLTQALERYRTLKSADKATSG